MGTKPDPSFIGRNEFLIRRLHSLTGLIPVGAYMVVHLATNASILNGVSTFQNAVFRIHSLGSLLPVVEWTFIFIPLLFHGIFGLFIIRDGEVNTSAYPLGGNIRYTAQRVSGALAFAFIAYHVFHMHGWIHTEWWLTNVAEPFGGYRFKPYNAASSASAAMNMSPIIWVIYLVGVAACVFHLVNGLWTMGITWGLWTTPKSQRLADRVVLVIGLFIAVLGISAWYGFSFSVDEAKAFDEENSMYEAQTASGIVIPDEHKRSAPHGEPESEEGQSESPVGEAE